MTAYTHNISGPPTGGFYTVGDTVTDVNSVVWTCAVTGFAGTDDEDDEAQARWT